MPRFVWHFASMFDVFCFLFLIFSFLSNPHLFLDLSSLSATSSTFYWAFSTTFNFHLSFSFFPVSNPSLFRLFYLFAKSATFSLAFSNTFDFHSFFLLFHDFCFFDFSPFRPPPPAMQVMHSQPPSIICITWLAFFLGTHLGVILGHVDFSRFPFFLKIHLQIAFPHGLRGEGAFFLTHFSPKKMNPAWYGHFQGPKNDRDDASYSFHFPFKWPVPQREVPGSLLAQEAPPAEPRPGACRQPRRLRIIIGFYCVFLGINKNWIRWVCGCAHPRQGMGHQMMQVMLGERGRITYIIMGIQRWKIKEN